jgi:hypothetical protein
MTTLLLCITMTSMAKLTMPPMILAHVLRILVTTHAELARSDEMTTEYLA